MDAWTDATTNQHQQEMAAAICRHCGKKRPHETRKVKLSRRCSSLPSPFLSYGQNDCFRQAPSSSTFEKERGGAGGGCLLPFVRPPFSLPP